MSKHDTQFLGSFLDRIPLRPRILNVVKIVDGETARYRIVILSSSVFESGMKRKDRQFLLQVRLDRFIFFFVDFTPTAFFECVFYLCTYSRYMSRIESLAQEVGRTYPNLASYIFCYSKHFLSNEF